MNELLEKMKTITVQEGSCSSNYAMIDCRIHLTDYGKLTRFKRFQCWSYHETPDGISGLILDKQEKFMFHFVAHRSFIMIYAVKNEGYKPQSFVDYFEQIKKSVDKNAELLTYDEFQQKHKDDEY